MINNFKEYQKKKKLFIEYNKSYYDLNSPKIDDATFDQFKKDLIEFENTHNIKDKITNIVGFTPSEKFSKIKHQEKMLSLDNAFNEEDILDFYKKINNYLNNNNEFREELYAEPKIDGISASLSYIDGKLARGLSRGDGEFGEDITENLETVDEIPKKLKKKLMEN